MFKIGHVMALNFWSIFEMLKKKKTPQMQKEFRKFLYHVLVTKKLVSLLEFEASMIF